MKKIFFILILFSFFIQCTNTQKEDKKTEKSPVILNLAGKVLQSKDYQPQIDKWEIARLNDDLTGKCIRTRGSSRCEVGFYGSRILIKENSVLSFKNRATDNKKIVELKAGKIFFKKEKPANEEDFVVCTDALSLSLKGTEFSLEIIKDPLAGLVSILCLKEGQVLVQRNIKIPPELEKYAQVLLSAGAQCTVSYAENKTMEKRLLEKQNGETLGKDLSIKTVKMEQEREFENIKYTYIGEGKGTLVVLGGDKTEIFVNQTLLGNEALSMYLDAGIYQVLIKRDNAVIKEQRAELHDRQTITVEAEKISYYSPPTESEKIIEELITKGQEETEAVLKRLEQQKLEAVNKPPDKQEEKKIEKQEYEKEDRGKGELEDLIKQ